MVPVSLGAAKMLEEIGISAEVIDPRTTWPLDKQASIGLGQEDLALHRGRRGLRALRRHRRDRLGRRRGRVLLTRRAGQAHRRHGRAGAVLAGGLEDLTVPSEKSVFEAAKALCGKKD
jgi:pyruvate dehydrogenase E1 component beta subunit